ncbi:hypothetical protein CHS0354_030747 [Potamilus streckersoni]|uniref:Uncharacterized protein n=1 Tax=Potamilus streckersoni TaxID=2493646 RepID=A0AAE0WCA7_9BIVA|nr:hypothetical protein CHS0354_030747 [Potamilus streckersoni]
MVKAICDADLPSVSCFAHTLQLALHDAILTQPSVADLITLMKDCGTFSTSFKCYLEPSCHSITTWSAKPLVASGCIDQMEFDLPDAGSFDRAKKSCVNQVQAKTDIIIATLLFQPSSSTATVQLFEVFPAADEQLPTKNQIKDNFWTSWDQLQPVEPQNDMSVTIETEVNNYLAEPRIPRDTDPLD